jgi:hypothetical protein
MTLDLTLAEHILKLARGSQIPTDPNYVESYFKVFDDLKIIIQGNNGFVKYVRYEMSQLISSATVKGVDKLDKKLVYQYLENHYDEITQGGKSFAEYVNETSLALYTAVMREERVILTDIETNLRKYHQLVTQEINNNTTFKWSGIESKKSITGDKAQDRMIKKGILDNLITLFDCYKTSFPVIHKEVQKLFVTSKDIGFLHLILGKVIEGSLSQSRKSKGGDVAERIIETLLKKQGLQVDPQEKETGTNTDLVVRHNGKKYCIAVQLSTNDRMRLSSDELHPDSTANYLVSLNGCEVSRKSLADISLQRMAKWMESEVQSGESIAYFVGIKTFIDEVRSQYLATLNIALSDNKLDEIKPSFLIGNMADIKDYLDELPPDFKEKFLLALWAYRKAISLDTFVTQLKA